MRREVLTKMSRLVLWAVTPCELVVITKDTNNNSPLKSLWNQTSKVINYPLAKHVFSFAMSVHVGFVVDKVALGLVSLRVLRFFLSVSFHRGSPYPYIIWGVNNRPIGDRRSETWTQSIDMNNNCIFRNECEDDCEWWIGKDLDRDGLGMFWYYDTPVFPRKTKRPFIRYSNINTLYGKSIESVLRNTNLRRTS
jgi:hypothetical protein